MIFTLVLWILARFMLYFLKVYNQPEVGFEGYDAGAEMLRAFFKSELQKYLKKDLLQTGKRIIEACLNDASVADYELLIDSKK